MKTTRGNSQDTRKTSDEVSQTYEDETAVVTGGTGFIGSNLVRRLLDLGVERVIVIDDLSSSFLWNLPKDRRVEFIQGSILNDKELANAFKSRPRFVFHLAAHFANQNSVDHAEDDLMVNGLGTLKLLQASKQAKVERFVFASSGCSVYGSEAPLPLKEEFVSLHLDTPYQITKLLGELYCNYYYNYYGLQVALPRFFNVYGPGEVPGKYRNVIPNFIFWALSREPLPIMATGEETRDFTFVGDIVNGVLRCGRRKEAVGEPINLASGKETKVKDLANIINRLTGNRAGITSVAKRTWDRSTRRRASIEKARRILDYSPYLDIESGIGLTIKWFKENWQSIKEDATF